MNEVEKTTEKQLGGATGKGFMPGVSGNPNGRPKGSGISITTEIKRKLAEVPEGQKATYLQLLINRILKQAIQDGDSRMIELIWKYTDGSPDVLVAMQQNNYYVDVNPKLAEKEAIEFLQELGYKIEKVSP